MSATPDQQFQVFAELYRKQIRPNLLVVDPDRVPHWDNELRDLEAKAAQPLPETAVCFLGNSGVGKSTLINAIAAGSHSVLPAGGVGPLTAQALEVRYAPNASFVVQYHGAQTLRSLLARFRSPISESTFLEEKELAEGEGNGSGQLSRREELRRQACLLLLGDQNAIAETDYLLDGVQEMLREEPNGKIGFQPEDYVRITRIREILAKFPDRRSCTVSAACVNDQHFLRNLHQHAAGFLAPLVCELKVYIDFPYLCQGLALVDLPGVGISSDAYRSITIDWVRNHAKVIVLVVDNRGITEAAADLLRSSEFLNRLQYALDIPDDDPVQLFIAVTKVDDVAVDERAKDRTRSTVDHLVALSDRFKTEMRGQLQRQVDIVKRAGRESLSPKEEQLVRRLVECVQIHPISAVQYRKLLEQDEDQPSFVRREDQTGIPQLREELRSLALSQQYDFSERRQKNQLEWMSRLFKSLQTFVPTGEDETRKLQEEAKRLQESFRECMRPLEKECDRRLGAFRALWEDYFPKLIDEQLVAASAESSRRIEAFIRGLVKVHVGTLQAAMRYRGVYNGSKNINLPHDLAICCDGVVAECWGDPILAEIRKRTKQFADDNASILEELVGWAEANNAPQLHSFLGNLSASIRADAEKFASVGNDHTNELREQINRGFVNQIEQPIRTFCDTFMLEGKNKGKGLRVRIIDELIAFSQRTSSIVHEVAKSLLLSAVQETESQVRIEMQPIQNPLGRVEEIAKTVLAEPSPEAIMKLEAGCQIGAAIASWSHAGTE